MMKAHKIIVVLGGAVLTVAMFVAAASADVTFEARVDRTETRIDEPITYTLEISGGSRSLPEPLLPQLADFDVYSSGRSTSFEIVNGQMSSSVIYNYALVPKKTGSLTIFPASITVEGKTYRTAPITINVLGAAQTPPPEQSPDQGQAAPTRSDKQHLIVRSELSRDTIYVNQSVTLSFRFYRGERLYSNPELVSPSFADFWKEDLPPQRKFYETIDGVRYDVTEIQAALFPISAGEKTIGQFTLNTSVEDATQRRRDPFGLFDDDFFSGFRRGKPVTLTTKPLTLVVLPLPTAGRPPEFSGLVGTFDITAQYDRTSVAVNEPITARVVISGRGNIKSITEPAVSAPADFRLYNAGATENVSKSGYRVSGTKTFEEVFVPRRAGTYELPAFTLSYFDPDRREYISRRTQPVTVTVTPGEGEFSIPPLANNANEIGYLAKDIRFLKGGDGRPFSRSNGGFPYLLFGIFHVVPLVGLGAVTLVKRQKNRLDSDVAYRRARHAGKTARKRFAKAKKFADAGSAAEFYPAVSAALTDFFGDRFNRSGLGMTRNDILTTFEQARVDRSLTDEFIGILDSCDHARFAPGAGGAESMRNLYHRAVDVVDKLDRMMRKSG